MILSLGLILQSWFTNLDFTILIYQSWFTNLDLPILILQSWFTNLDLPILKWLRWFIIYCLLKMTSQFWRQNHSFILFYNKNSHLCFYLSWNNLEMGRGLINTNFTLVYRIWLCIFIIYIEHNYYITNFT
uniref:Uncharacterized protein n=1 Tax=Capsaspora owczarzaki TaxID=192875 RepID=M1K4T1_9EUKA|nr:hypothetical protein [Capsaspora owczarzaki]